MPTTLISNAEANGVGVMAQHLARHVSSVTKVVSLRLQREFMNLVEWPHNVVRFDRFCPEAKNDKYLYFEESCGLGRQLEGQRIWVPMWEQASVGVEAKLPARVICITRKTERFLKQNYGVTGEYLPWPVELPGHRRLAASVKTVLHNAGSFGANFRKGTFEAIEIFQRSGVAKKGVRLVVHSWVLPSAEVMAAVNRNALGIDLVCRFEYEVADVYRVADLLLLPTKMDGSPLQVVEAAAHGVPSLVSDFEPMNEAESDPDYLIPVARTEPSALNEPYRIVDVEAGAEKLAKLCERDLTEKHKERRAFAVARSWLALGEAWREVCK